jgi:hypothetical protein
MKKTLLGAEVWTVGGGYCSEMGFKEPVCWGKVVRQTPKSIWIKDWSRVEKWNLQSNGYWKCPSQYGTITKDFEFRLDPLVAFIHSKETT